MPDPTRSAKASSGGHDTIGPDADDLQLLAIDLMAAAVGGPTHLGHGLRLERGSPARNDYATLIGNLAAILDKFEITEPARRQMMALITSFETQFADQ